METGGWSNFRMVKNEIGTKSWCCCSSVLGTKLISVMVKTFFYTIDT